MKAFLLVDSDSHAGLSLNVALVWSFLLVATASAFTGTVRKYGIRAAVRPAERSRHAAPGRCTRRASVARKEALWAPQHRGFPNVWETLRNARNDAPTWGHVSQSIITAKKGWTSAEA